MTPERWRRIDEVYNEALERDPESRSRYLDGVCGDDADLRREVDSLLAASQQTAYTFDRPAMDAAAESLARERSKDTMAASSTTLPSLGDRYEVLEETGRGGMGIVYRVRDTETEEIIAVKVLKDEAAADPMMLGRFKKELKLARLVTHRHVCRIYDISRSGHLTYISMEFVEGDSLRRMLNRVGPFTVRLGLEMVRQIAEGLREAHRQQIIHRDLKPENIMIDLAGNVKVMDFGIARLLSSPRTSTIYIAGTPSYMSPEQLEGKPVDQRSDIYSLGLVAYEMLTGRAAFVGNTPASVAARQLREAPPSPRTIDPSIPANVEAVILRCLERDPARRYASLDELIAALPPPEATTRDWDPRPGPVYIMSPGKARALLLVIQTGYLALYVAALYHLDAMTEVLKTQMGFSPGVAGLAPLIAMASIAVRIYLFSALAFNHPATGRQYWRMCLGLLVLDELWAFAPLLLVGRIPLGLALVFTVGLAYLPFGQKTLFSNAYPEAPASLPVSSR